MIPVNEPVLSDNVKKYVNKRDRYPVSDYASAHGFYVPSGLAITGKQIHAVAVALRAILQSA